MNLPESARLTAAPLSRAWLIRLSQFAALAGAIALGWRGYALVLDSRNAIDEAAAWYGGALVLLVYFAWDRTSPAVASWPSRVRAYARAHPLELIGVAAVIGIAALMRLYTWGDLPPDGFLCCEEHISGGVGWEIQQGQRPYAFALVRYSVALGTWLVGPTTTGLRIVMFTAGVLCVVPFYLIMREVVDRPAALFATAIFACLRFTYISIYFQTPLLFTLLFVWTSFRTLKTGNAMWAVPAGALAALISYEYEAFKAVPLLMGAFLAFLALRTVMWPLPRATREVIERVRGIIERSAKPALAFVIALLIVISPMMAERSRGIHIYVSSLNRQLNDRNEEAGFFAPNAWEQLRWTAEVYTPSVDPSYLPARVGHLRTVDYVTSALIWAALAATIATFWRGWRLAFLLWFGGGTLISALLLSTFAEWKLMAFLPPAIALIGIVANDVLGLVRDRWRPIAYGGLAAIATGVVAMNLWIMREDANDPFIQRFYANDKSEAYVLCDYLRGRPDGSYSLVSARNFIPIALAKPQGTPGETKRAFNDFTFVCEGQHGQALRAPQDIARAPITPDRDYTIAFVGTAADVRRQSAQLQRLMPELGEADVVRDSPAEIFRLVGFEASFEELSARRGLIARAVSASGEVIEEQVVYDGDASGMAREHPDAVIQFLGLTYLDREYFQLTVAPTDTSPVTITLDGQTVHREGQRTSVPVTQGWHAVRAEWPAGATPVALEFVSPADGDVPVIDGPMFALDSRELWAHARTLLSPEGVETKVMTYDFGPQYLQRVFATVDGINPLPAEWTVVSDRWWRSWDVAAGGEYLFRGETREGGINVTIDGTPIVAASNGFQTETDISAGEHTIEVVYSPRNRDRQGGTLVIVGPDQVTVDITSLEPIE